jgi:hypothetical protein
MLSSENEAGGTAVVNLVRLGWGFESFDELERPRDFDELAYCKAK